MRFISKVEKLDLNTHVPIINVLKTIFASMSNLSYLILRLSPDDLEE